MQTIRVPIAVQQAVMQQLRQSLRLANIKLNTNYPLPEVNYRQRGTSAGTAHLHKWQIHLNAILLLENQQAFIDDVINHELAHLLVYRHFGHVAPHGKEWQWMMEHILATTANRTHQFSVSSVQGKTFRYHCACQQHQLTIRRHNRMQRKETQYHCCRCKQPLIKSPD